MAAFLIQRGAIVDVHAAARHGMLERVKEFISANPESVHARGGDGQLPLHFASTIEIAAYLLDCGANIDARDVDHESTAAQYRVRSHPEIARYLIRRGCRTDILMAAALGDADLVSQHLDADPGCIRMYVGEEFFPKRNPHSGGTIYIWTLGANRTAHQVAWKFGHPEIVNLLMDRSPAEVKLINACAIGDEETVNRLRTGHPGLIQALSPADRDSIARAAEDNNIEAVRLMLESGWPVDAGRDATPLHFAAWHGNAEMARLILRYHPPLELLDRVYHAAPLGWAIHGSEHGLNRKTGDYAGTVEALLEAGAKPR